MPAWLEDKFEGLDLSAEEMQRIKTTLRNNGITDDQDRLAEGFIDNLNTGFTSLGFSAAVVGMLESLKIYIAPTIKVKKKGKGHRWEKYFFMPEFGGFLLASFQRFDKQGRMTIPEKLLMHAKSPESSYGTPWYFKKETSGWQVVFEGTGSG
jgi:hypothetical protein